MAKEKKRRSSLACSRCRIRESPLPTPRYSAVCPAPGNKELTPPLFAPTLTKARGNATRISPAPRVVPLASFAIPQILRRMGASERGTGRGRGQRRRM